jgi:hypothetical protein
MESGLLVAQCPQATLGGCVGRVCAPGHGQFVGGCVGFVRSEGAEHVNVGGCVGRVFHPGASRFVGGCTGFISLEGHSAAPGRRNDGQPRFQTQIALRGQRPKRIAARISAS